MSTLEVTSDTENKLLSRREVKGIFRGGNGLLTRQGAAEAIASKLGGSDSYVQIISLLGRFGVRDLDVNAYVFKEEKIAKQELPEYFLIRQLPKEERKKAREEKKKAKSATPAAAPEKKK